MIRLRDALDAVIQEFTYNDGWYPITDGDGFSLTIPDPEAADLGLWNIKDGWRPSAAVGGSPGSEDENPLPDPGSVVINKLLAHSHSSTPDWIELHNTTDQTTHIGGWFQSDDAGDEASNASAALGFESRCTASRDRNHGDRDAVINARSFDYPADEGY